jgi:hypothetical protein
MKVGFPRCTEASDVDRGGSDFRKIGKTGYIDESACPTGGSQRLWSALPYRSDKVRTEVTTNVLEAELLALGGQGNKMYNSLARLCFGKLPL